MPRVGRGVVCMKLTKMRPKTIAQYARAEELVRRGHFERHACQRVGLSYNWFNQIRNAMKDKDAKMGERADGK